MANSLYIAGIEPRSGKSVVALGVMELLSRRVRKIGYFRPVIPSLDAPDNNIELIRYRYDLQGDYEEMYGCAHDEAQAISAEESPEALLKRIVDKYKALEKKSQFILCEGTDFSGVSSAFEFQFNARVAANLDCPILVLLNGRRKTTDEIQAAIDMAHESFKAEGCPIVATIINRAPTDLGEALSERFAPEADVKSPVFQLPEIEALGKTTVNEIAEALKAQVLQGERESLYRIVKDLKVAAMNFPHRDYDFFRTTH